MLVLTRKQGQEILIDGLISIAFVQLKGRKVRLGIRAPKGVRIERSPRKNEESQEQACGPVITSALAGQSGR